MLTITALTFKEALRKKILIAAIFLTVLFLVVYGIGLHYIAQDMAVRKAEFATGGGSLSSEQEEAVRDLSKKGFFLLGIYFSSSIVSLLAIFSSIGSVSSEMENGMLHAIAAKPIRRRDIILGKFLGYALMLTSYSAVIFISVLLLNHYIFGSNISGISSSVGLFIMQPLILLSISLAGSTRLSTLANGIAIFMLYTVGVIGGMLEQIGAFPFVNSAILVRIGEITSLIMPVDSIYRMIVTIVSGASMNPYQAMLIGPFGAIS
ncbi:MAG: ABC transporter permease [Firmicutes bacterium]|nr:ABC transporter permease [Bacillota bacterium]